MTLRKLSLTIFLFIALFFMACLMRSCEVRAEEIDIEKLADAIYKAENSVKYPYGIKSINTKGDKKYARKICLNSIRNNLKRWEKIGSPKDFITFMGQRYSPPKENPHWVRLVTYFYEK